MRRGVSQRNDNVRPNASNLLAQKRRAGKHLFWTRIAISRRTAFEHVGDIDLLARQARQRQDAVEVLARSAHKGFSLQVFIATRRLAHKHHARMGVARAKDNLGPRLAQLAQAAVAAGADYVAFGAVCPSPTKPQAVRAPLTLFEQGRRTLGVPLCAIGGITLDSAPEIIAAGADMLAVISDLFDAPDIAARASHFQTLFMETSRD